MSENEYRDWVLEYYELQLAAGMLTSGLVSPTPGSLKAEAVKICEQRFHTKDEVLLRSFFNQKDGAAGYRQAIQNSNADLFRPLNNLLKDHTINTTLKNIDLLAWLIDFNPRPYHPVLVRITKNTTLNPNSIISSPDQIPKTIKKNNIQIYIFLCITFIAGSYLVYNYYGRHLSGKETCMYWQDDHYQPIDCGVVLEHGQIQPINKELVANFKKITRPDTLTPYSVRKVWYVNYNGRIDFFTTNGPYPIDTNKRLLPMTDHILKKYVYHISN